MRSERATATMEKNCGCGHDHSHEHAHPHSHGVCSCGSSEPHNHDGEKVGEPMGQKGGYYAKESDPDSDEDDPSCSCSAISGDESHTHHHEGEACGCDVHDHSEAGCDCNPFEHGSIFTEDEHEDHDHSHGDESTRFSVIKLSLSAVFLALGYFLRERNSVLSIISFAVSYLLAGYPYLIETVKNVIAKRPFDETLLMTVATIGAIAIGEWSEACLVMLLFGIGQLLERLAVARSKKNIASLLDLKPDFANLFTDGEIRTVAPGEIKIDDVIVVRPFERVPLDGVVIEGEGSIDSSMLTGESLPQSMKKGSRILSGCINGESALTVRVTETYDRSTVSKIINLTEQAAKNKAKSERFITKFARVYTPIVVGLALIVAVLVPVVIGLITGNYEFSRWIYTALTFLIISCPCALVISVPLTFVSGIGSSSKRGILVKGADSLERLVNTDCIAFDKTGTLTRGHFEVQDIVSRSAYSAEQMLRFAAHAEHLSTHPVAKAIVIRYDGAIDPTAVSNIEEMAGKGVRATVDGHSVLIGSRSLLIDGGVAFEEREVPKAKTISFLAVDGVYAGYITAGDELRADAKETVATLKSRGIHTVMLTGDAEDAAAAVAAETGVDEYRAALLPEDKLDIVLSLKERYKEVVFIGDGINDAPVITAADTGVSMGGLGSDAAIEASDVVLMTDEPKRIITAIDIAKRTRGIVLQNVILSLSIKLIVMVLGLMSAIPLWLAVVADVGSMMIAVANALRAMRFRN